jgi:hypothetical protein
MSTSFVFGNKNIQKPGAYSQIAKAVTNQPVNLSSGNVLIIDTGNVGAGWGASGINGDLLSGKDSIYSFTTSGEFKQFIRGGEFYALSDALFQPNGSSPGISKLYYVSARTTEKNTITLDLTNGAAGGTVVIDAVEGLGGVGVEDTGVLKTGFAATMEAGVFDPAKFIFKFWVGSHTGIFADDGKTIDGSAVTPSPTLLASSPEVATLAELEAWMNGDFNFQKWFKVQSVTPVGTGAIDALDLAALAGTNVLAVGGTDTYGATDFDDVLTAIKDLDYTFVITDDIGSNADSVDNLKLLSHLQTDARFTKFMFVGGGDESGDFLTESVAPAQAMDSIHAIVVHGGIKKNLSFVAGGQRNYSSLHKVGYIVGRLAGLEPQFPGTFKLMNYDGERHEMTDEEMKYGTDNGVYITGFDNDLNGFVGVYTNNTIQANTQLVNPDGTSFSVQAMRIIAQLNKEIEVTAKIELLGNQTTGATKASLRDEDVRAWLAGYLTRQTSTDTEANMIISFRDITVSRNQDAIFVTYGVEINTEITKIFFSGVIVEI